MEWFEVSNAPQLPSPALLIYPDRIKQNIEEMLQIAGGPQRLRPHIKTHKTLEIIRLQQEAGIKKFKCATLAEAELLGEAAAEDVLLAYQAVGPSQQRFLDLKSRYPNTRFSALVDHFSVLESFAEVAKNSGTIIELFADLNVGMNRTGIVPGPAAFELCKALQQNPHITFRGLHAYDGHIRDTDFSKRKLRSDQAFESVTQLAGDLEEAGIPVNTIIAGGSPSFPVHALRESVELSPGTTLLWDARYAELFPEMRFIPAAVLLGRVISNPDKGVYCVDVGHKALAPEMPFPRVAFLNQDQTEQIGQSEEHLVLKLADDRNLNIGQVLYALPMHICPTVAKYPVLHCVEENLVKYSWKVAARDYQIFE